MEQSYQELFKIFKEKSTELYEKEAEKISKEKDFRFQYESFIPYPSYKNKDFNHIILKKEEFHRNRSLWEKDADYDEIVADRCSGEFKLTPNQKFIKNFMSPLTPYRSLLIYHGVGVGKCHAKDTPILMFDGSIKAVQDVKIGDLLMGDDSSPRKVLSLATGIDMMYEIKQSHANSYTVNSEHILVLRDINTKQILEIEVKDYLKLPEHIRSSLMGFSTFIDFPSKPVSIPTEFNGIVPDEIMYNCVKTRLKYLIFIIQTYGKIEDNYIILNYESKHLTFLGRSLGFAVSIQNGITTFHKDSHSYLEVTETHEDTYYGFVIDGNHRYLLGDCTVTHNTCTAINIAEQYFDNFERKVLVILSSNIEENFRKQIYDINKLSQCTGTKYPDMILNKQLLSKASLEKKVNDIIKQRYEFMGYKELAMWMDKKRNLIKQQIKDPVDPSKLPDIERRRQNAFAEIIRERFSNRLMIIDEAHNLRLPSEQGQKQISAAFLEMLKIVENVKLVLMTATPMYNTADEIVWMMNLLLTNDQVNTITRSTLFDKDANLTKEGEEKLRNISRGYISYMRGENPYSFPFRLFPSINNPSDPNILKTYPTKDIYGEPIAETNKVKFLEIITSKMSDYQYEVYNSFKKKIKKSEEVEDLPEDLPDETLETNDVQKTMQISNVVYPYDNWKSNARLTYGSKGFDNCFQKSYGKIYKIKYKKPENEFLNYDKLDQYAPKMKTLINYIKNAKGIVFIYSRYYEAGLLPLACALEHAGMVKYSSDGEQRNIMENITIQDQFRGKKPKYVILSRRQELSPNNDVEIEKAKSKDNINGEIIKVIIVSKIGTEGIDFKRIREVHILEPWYNLNRAEQIIGRAVRTCSHVDLPKSERNVTIYFHANICKNNEESVDLRTYRISETKQKKIIKVENILKENSIDCNLNKDVLLFTPNKMKLKLNIETAQGKKVKYEVGDKDYSFICGFMPCKFECNPSYPDPVQLDNSTFDLDFITDDIQMMKKYISFLYQDRKEKTYEEILKQLKEHFKMIEEQIVKFCLEEMLIHKHQIHTPKGDGYLIYRSNKYIFQFENIHDSMMTLEDRLKVDKGARLFLDVSKVPKIEIAPVVEEKEVVAKKSVDSMIMEYYENIVKFYFETFITDFGGLKAFLKPTTKLNQTLLKLLESYKPTVSNDKEYKELIKNLNEQHIYDGILDRLTIEELFEVSDQSLLEEFKIKDFILNAQDKNLYKLKGDKVVACSQTDYMSVQEEYDEFKSNVKAKADKGVKYYTIWQKNKLMFKVRDSDATLGAVCTTSPTAKSLKEKVELILEKTLKETYRKDYYCTILEVLARKNSKEFQRALYIVSKN